MKFRDNYSSDMCLVIGIGVFQTGEAGILTKKKRKKEKRKKKRKEEGDL